MVAVVRSNSARTLSWKANSAKVEARSESGRVWRMAKRSGWRGWKTKGSDAGLDVGLGRFGRERRLFFVPLGGGLVGGGEGEDLGLGPMRTGDHEADGQA